MCDVDDEMMKVFHSETAKRFFKQYFLIKYLKQ